LRAADFDEIKVCIKNHYQGKSGVATADFNALRTVLERQSRHIWITFEDGYMWWCTVRDGIEINPDKNTKDGNIWLMCDRPWSNRSIGGALLACQTCQAPS
jgi:hypothetical protein